ncbi:hypothetical protein MHK_011026, partial [Candidatus Magnetomorum sp. HK-1]
STRISKLYRNNGGSFTENTNANLIGLLNSSASFGDYDNDGDLDILLTGRDASNTGRIKIYRNDNGNFTEAYCSNMPDVYFGVASFMDYDNDNDLDIILTGNTGSETIARVYRNTINSANTRPTMPSNLNAVTDQSKVTLSWSAASDAQTLTATGL